jgi:LuxR family maltose regulon positive regulatory protein
LARCVHWRWRPPGLKLARSRLSPGALALACSQGYVWVSADEGPPMAALLGRLIAAQRAGQAAAEVPLGYLARLQRAFGPGQPAHDPAPPGIVDR